MEWLESLEGWLNGNWLSEWLTEWVSDWVSEKVTTREAIASKNDLKIYLYKGFF